MKEHVDLRGLSPLQAARLYDSPGFENHFAYEGKDLGACYSPDATVWKLWSPCAGKVSLRLYSAGSEEEEGEALGVWPMTLEEQGVWTVRVPGDCRNVYYTYEISVAGQTWETADPYARAAGVNGRRSMVVNLEKTNPAGWTEDTYCFRERTERALVWEVHVRDFSDSEDSGMVHRGQYLAFTEQGTTVGGRGGQPTGVAYLQQLGITHVQLLPVFDFATVDERRPRESYNWGYDPQNFNVPEGSYATDPYKGEARIREFKEMVLALHRAGIGVIMDVVYNHTFAREDSFFHRVMPWYYHRIWKDGSFCNGSGCGNEIASERYMVRRFIVDSVRYWAEEYHIDGFRFDLMGLMDVETLNQIRQELNALPGGKNILMYGEPWSALPPGLRKDSLPAVRSTAWRWEKGIGYFNDEGRDALKGSSFEAGTPGFITAAGGRQEAVLRMAAGEPDPDRMVQYTGCHDNYTLWDKITMSAAGDGSGFDAPEMLRVAVNKIAAAAVLCARGLPFLLAGEEFGRTKYGEPNSYRSPLNINRLCWSRTETFRELVEYYRGLIALRRRWIEPEKETPCRLEVLAREDNLAAWKIRQEQREIVVLLNPGPEPREVETGEGDWQVKADERQAGTRTLWKVRGDHLVVQPRGVVIALFDK